MTIGLLVSHKGDHCGVYQFGRNLFEALSEDKAIDWSYCECSSFEEVNAAFDRMTPDAIIFNHHPYTMPWLAAAPLRQLESIHFGLLHQVSQDIADGAKSDPFDYLICLDPTLAPRNPKTLRAPRFLPAPPASAPQPPNIFTVGSFGFGAPNKGFDRLCSLVNDQFDRAIIRLNLPRHDDPKIIPEEMLAAVVEKCRRAVTKPGVQLDITHNFFTNSQIIEFLASNTVNAFLYDDSPSTGISSCVDFALASGRPFALTRSSMFRNLFHLNPSPFIEDRTLADIAAGDTSNLVAVRAALAPEKAASEWNATILQAVASKRASRSTPDRRGFNKILDDRSRIAYQEALDDLAKFAPEMIARKIERANIQQAFGLDTARRFLAQCPNARILAAGSFEDTAVATLRAQGYRIDEIDPNVNGMTLQDFYISTKAQLGSYDLVLSISVLEHVADDVQFLRIISEFLRPGGLAVLTVDFAEDWRPGKHKPEVDHRLYTTRDICERLMPAIGDCVLVDPPRWSEGVEDFEYEGSQYGFAGFVFRKLDADSVRLAAMKPVWRDLLAEASSGGRKTHPNDKMTALKRLFVRAR
jgi:SAM-dependent methyltransferase